MLQGPVVPFCICDFPVVLSLCSTICLQELSTICIVNRFGGVAALNSSQHLPAEDIWLLVFYAF